MSASLSDNTSEIETENMSNDDLQLLNQSSSSNPLDEETKTNIKLPSDSQIQKKKPWLIKRIRIQLFLFFYDSSSSKFAMLNSIFIMLVILMSTINFALESIPEYSDYPIWFKLETFAVVVFTIEYVCRIQGCYLYEYGGTGLKSFLYDFMNTVDLLAILPFYIELALGGSAASNVGIIRVVRLARVFRIFKFSKYNEGFQLVAKATKKSINGFNLLIFLLSLAIVVFSSVLYFAELGGQTFDEEKGVWIRDMDGSESPFQSIPSTFWWAIVTMTTVGYGDTYPVTNLGKLVAACTMIIGLLVLAFPVTIFGINMGFAYEDEKAKKEAERIKNKANNDDGINTIHEDTIKDNRDSMQNMKRSSSLTRMFSSGSNSNLQEQKKHSFGGSRYVIDALNQVEEHLTALSNRMDKIEQMLLDEMD
ncbi:voltage-gated potassium channel [Anaeramoeba flamelloides]|uniref:Voltage-gated potassium channel n=1 Tax=Anaeramoeba flamelloides TaxID=1746091 RepID=A0AAV7Y9C5_9EUKA|nr:voltage-gated potassium channel [Anaeramoeba flamelloides]